MIIRQIFNNNVIRVEDQVGREYVVIGNGLGFKRKPGQPVDQEKIEKTFMHRPEKVPQKLIELIGETSVDSYALADRIIKLAKEEMGNIFDDNIYITLMDHIHFAVARMKKSMGLKNALLWQIKKFYPQEFMIGLKALGMIKEQFNVEMDAHEAGFIAMHFVNAQQDKGGMKNSLEVAKLIDDTVGIVSNYFSLSLDEDSFNYSRFITHLQYFGYRLLNGEQERNTSGDVFLYDQVKVKYPKAFECTNRINSYLEEEYESAMTIDEKVFLTVHIERLTTRSK
ncbi:BglG family transcriptional antiterminator [Planomicrobium soli]|uniref:BglG family transcriptional antiterminator n=1 Tax=Planomicrobium soli TaxID=1176648 RepID=A0A2P8GQH2_9BACL|nr:PRD domain-containing protein [Planomicrobium soli]PSL36210.1 BglG family transcriptional antiterminator [Planomicrobium soli]